MPKDTDSTIKFKADISDLKSSMQEAGRYIRLANSEFKAATAGMDDWSKSADGLSAKTRQLNTILQAQTRQLDSLEAQYAKVVEEQGENSKGAEELKIKINNQKAAIAQTQTQLVKYESDLEEVTKGTKDAGKAAEEAANGGFTILKGAMANLVAQGISACISGLKDLGSSLINLGKQALESYGEFEQLEGGIQKLFGAGGMSIEEYAASVGKTVDEIEGEYNNLMSAQEQVMANAQNAYRTAGLSANDYMETVTSFSASLISGLNGDTEEAARIADIAIQGMSDNANTFGTDIQSIQNAYQGFAKGNFTMLDNLKLGYGGTKEEMLRLVNESGVLEEAVESIDDVSFDQIILAIEATQERMGIAGTTAREASKTIQGSVNAMQAAWQNLVTGIADDNADFRELMDNFIDSLMTALDNILPRVETIIGGLGQLVGELIRELLPLAIDLINDELPTLMQMGSQLLYTVISGILRSLPQLTVTAVQIMTQLISGLSSQIPLLMKLIVQIVPQLITALVGQIPTFLQACVNFLMSIVRAIPVVVRQLINALPEIINAILTALTDALPLVLDGAIQLLSEIVNAIPTIITELSNTLPDIIDTILDALIDALPVILDGAITLLMTIVDAIPTIVQSLSENFPQIINRILTSLIEAFPQVLDGGIQLLLAIVDAIPEIVAALIDALPEIITTITTTLIDNIPLILDAGIQLLGGLIDAFPEVIVSLGESVTDLIDNIVTGFNNAIPQIRQAGKDLITGLWNGMNDKTSWLANKIRTFCDAALDEIKEFFGIASPSTVMRDQIGKWLPPGITVGFENAMPAAIKTMASSAKDMAQNIADEMSEPLTGIGFSGNVQSLNDNGGVTSGDNVSGGSRSITFNQTINSPEPVNRLTVFRDTNSLLFSAGVSLNNV